LNQLMRPRTNTTKNKAAMTPPTPPAAGRDAAKSKADAPAEEMPKEEPQ